MAIYAVDNDDLIHASDAESGKIYWCLDCFGPVKRRKRHRHLAHFYHLRASPSCRLYSKSEDHLVAQLELQKTFPEGEIQLERPFIQIDRVTDACWESKKIVFEIQCSPMSEKEAQMRIRDYRSIGYEVVWLLDDKRYNKRVSRPAEEFLRKQSTYYMSVKTLQIYDQFEIFLEKRRVRKGKKMLIDLQTPIARGQKNFNADIFPKQIVELEAPHYFYGDRLHKAYRNHFFAMQQWRALELYLAKNLKNSTGWVRRFFTWIANCYIDALERYLKTL